MLFPKHENVSTACRFTSFRPYVLAPLCPCAQARRFVEIFGGVQLNNQNFFGEISRILFALFVHRRLCLQCWYVTLAHLMQFLFFFGVEPFRK